VREVELAELGGRRREGEREGCGRAAGSYGEGMAYLLAGALLLALGAAFAFAFNVLREFVDARGDFPRPEQMSDTEIRILRLLGDPSYIGAPKLERYAMLKEVFPAESNAEIDYVFTRLYEARLFKKDVSRRHPPDAERQGVAQAIRRRASELRRLRALGRTPERLRKGGGGLRSASPMG
jgi:hypothetical protein